MSVETRLRTALMANVDVAALVVARIYPDELPQSPVLPAIVYQRISGTRPVDQDGTPGPAALRIQFDLYAATQDARSDLREKVRTAINGLSAVGIQGAFHEDEVDSVEDEVKGFRTSMDFMVFEGAGA